MVALSGCSHHGMCYLLKLAMKSSTSCLVKVQEDINISVGPAMKPSFAHAVGAQGSSHLTQSHFSMVVLKEQCRDQNSMSTRLPCRGDVEHLISLLRKPLLYRFPRRACLQELLASHGETLILLCLQRQNQG